MVEAGEPLVDLAHVKWAQAFAQMRWIVAEDGYWRLTKDGATALRNRDAEVCNTRMSKKR